MNIDVAISPELQKDEDEDEDTDEDADVNEDDNKDNHSHNYVVSGMQHFGHGQEPVWIYPKKDLIFQMGPGQPGLVLSQITLNELPGHG